MKSSGAVIVEVQQNPVLLFDLPPQIANFPSPEVYGRLAPLKITWSIQWCTHPRTYAAESWDFGILMFPRSLLPVTSQTFSTCQP